MTKVTIFAGVDIGKTENALTLMLDNNSPYVEKNRKLNSRNRKNKKSDPAIIFQGMFKNQLSGFRKMLKEASEVFSKLDIAEDMEIHFAMESTGTYYLKFAKFLYDLEQKNQEEQGNKGRKFSIYVLNPWQVKHFEQSLNIINSNDKADSCVIARCIRSSIVTGDMKFREWFPGKVSVSQLKELVRNRVNLVKMQVMEKNRKDALLQNPDYSEMVMHNIEEHIDYLQNKIDEIGYVLEGNAKNGIYDEGLQRDVELLCTIPGVKYITALTFIAEIKDIDRFQTVKQLVAFFGMAPLHKTSGTSVHRKPKLSKKGSSNFRACLYMAAMNAKRTNPVIKEFHDRVIKNGTKKGKPEKEKMVALAASMRKLIHIMYGVLKNGKPFNPEIAMAHCK